MGNALFIVWRESIEAILVVGILYAWMRENEGGTVKSKHLWWGVSGGIAAAAALAVAMSTVQSQLAGIALDIFQLAIVFSAAALISQMVLWMRRHGRHLKRDMQTGIQQAAAGRGAGLAAGLLAAAAVAREGAETVLFLYGLAVERHGSDLASLSTGAAIGFALALLTAWAIAKWRQFVSWRLFFRSTEILLLLLAASLMTSGIEKVIDLEWLPRLIDPLFDISAILDDSRGLGNLLAAFTGYRSRPALTSVIAYLLYWAAIGVLMARTSGAPRDTCEPRAVGNAAKAVQ